MNKYLFRTFHNGYYVDYTPFLVGGSLSQETVNELILSVNRIAGRVGSSIDDLMRALDDRKFIFKKYHSVYYKSNEYDSKYHDHLDPLPDCMYSWDVLENISGNY